MRNITHWIKVAGVAAALTGLAGRADAQTFSTNMNGATEAPPNASLATGTTTVKLTGSSLTVFLDFINLSSGAAAGHLHCCIAAPGSVGVAIPFVGFPLGATAGMYSHVFDLSDPATYTASFLSAFGGGTAAGGRAAFIAGLNAGTVYSNIHDANFPGGEIRGFLHDGGVTATPEPASLVLLGTGLVGMFGIARRKRSA